MIKSTFEIVHTEKYQCSKCVKKTSEAVRENVLSCTGKKDLKRNAGSYTYNACPGNFYSQSVYQVIEAHRMFRKGILANKDGLLDQSSKYLEIMNLIEALTLEKEIAQLSKSTGGRRGSSNGRKQGRG